MKGARSEIIRLINMSRHLKTELKTRTQHAQRLPTQSTLKIICHLIILENSEIIIRIWKLKIIFHASIGPLIRPRKAMTEMPKLFLIGKNLNALRPPEFI